MSSWFSLSLTNPFKSDDGDDAGGGENPSPSSPEVSDQITGGVKEDLAAISKTFSHRLRGVAAFLAPPPQPSSDGDDDDQIATSEALAGIKSDLVEIGDSFKSGFSLISSNKAVSEISKLASNFLQFGDEASDRKNDDDDYDDDEDEDDEDEDEDVVGITDDVVDFVTTISERPQLWTDFPLSVPSDFSMSDSQREHVSSIEQFVPALESLRQNVCHELTNGQFWMIYFVLLVPRLNQNDLELLSNPEIVEVRETLLQQLQNKKNAEPEVSKDSENAYASEKDVKVSQFDESNISAESTNAAQDRDNENNISTETAHSAQDRDNENNISAVTTNPAQDRNTVDSEKSPQQLEDEKTRYTASNADKQFENEEDVSFSDLEDDDTDLSDRLHGTKPTHKKKLSSSSESHEWIQLNENSKGLDSQQKARRSTHRDKDSESEDWLTVDDVDF